VYIGSVELLSTKEFKEFSKNLDPINRGKVSRSIDLLKEFNYRLGMPYCKKISKDLYELRLIGKTNLRILYTFNKNRLKNLDI
jgi:hypothetical protein